MSIVDLDGGLVFQGYNPRILTDRLPREQPPFYFGGSQVPTSIKPIIDGLGYKGYKTMPVTKKEAEMRLHGSGVKEEVVSKVKPQMKTVKYLPNVHKSFR
jgi:hypothetical protein